MQRRRIRKILVAWVTALTLLAPMFASAGEWQTYLHEDFSSAQTMFYTGPLGTAYYGIDESGRYVVDGLTAPGDSMAILTDSLYYYYFEAECEVLDTLAGDLASSGIVFHYNKRIRPGQNSYYVFYVYSDGYYGVKRVIGDSDGNVDILIPLAKSEMIDANYPNVLAVDAQGSRFDLYINGKYVDGFTDLAIDGGGFGFYATKQTKAAYDNFSVKIERRELGRDNLAQPTVNNPGESTQSGFSFEGYSPPVIKKDPNRPLYPWEVGYVEPEDTKQTADEPVVEAVPVDPPARQAPFEPAPKPVRNEPVPEPETDSHESGSAQAVIVDQPIPVVEQPRAVAASPATEGHEPGDPPANGGDVQTHSFGDFGYDEDSSEVKLVPANELEKPVPSSSEPDPSVAAAATQETPTAIPAAEETRLPSIASPKINTPDLDIRPDWLLESEPPKSVEVEAGGTEAGNETLPLEPPTAATDSEASNQVVVEQPVQEAASEPKAPKPVRRRSSGISGNDEYWESDPVDSRDYTRKPPKEDKPRTEVEPESGNEPGQSTGELVSEVQNHSGDGGSPSNNGNSQLSLFPTTEEPSRPVESPLAPNQDTEETGSQLDGQQPAPTFNVLSFREASPDTPSDQNESGVDTPSGQPTGSPEAEPKLVNPVDLTETKAPTATPVIETEVVITNSPEPVVTPEPAEIPAVEPSDGLSAPELPAIEYQPERKHETQHEVEPLALFTPSAPADEALERPGKKPQITIIDDFSEQTWSTGDNGISSYRYFGAAYEIDNRMAETMAISFQQNELATAQYTVESEFLDGISDVGYGLAAHFQVNGGNASYYGLFISHSGEYLLLKVVGGQENVLVDWMPCNLLKPNMPNVISLEVASPAIKVFINGKLITSVLDSSLRSGGYALLAGPGVAARFDNLVVTGDPRQ